MNKTGKNKNKLKTSKQKTTKKQDNGMLPLS